MFKTFKNFLFIEGGWIQVDFPHMQAFWHPWYLL